MAKAKKSRSTSGKNKPHPKKRLSRASLVASRSVTSFSVNVGIDFISGLGQATVILFRNGVLINMQSISSTGSVFFSEAESRDTIAINGVCSGKAKVTINVPTNPSTPDSFDKVIMAGYTIL